MINITRVQNTVIFAAKTMHEPPFSWGVANVANAVIAGGAGWVVAPIIFVGATTNAAMMVWRRQHNNQPFHSDYRIVQTTVNFFTRPSAYFYVTAACSIVAVAGNLSDGLRQMHIIDPDLIPRWFQGPQRSATASFMLCGWPFLQAVGNSRYGWMLNHPTPPDPNPQPVTAGAMAKGILSKPPVYWSSGSVINGLISGGMAIAVAPVMMTIAVLHSASKVLTDHKQPSAPESLSLSAKIVQKLGGESTYFFAAAASFVVFFAGNMANMLKQLNVLDLSAIPEWLQGPQRGVTACALLCTWAALQAKGNCHYALRMLWKERAAK
ncbi:MAG: hypothetical protein EYC62_09750 [Alphaproteobacteria bacterium]|nr:MAG: hypothetical protein EYC62_09750 [Alphaproteobacteria bacterium]